MVVYVDAQRLPPCSVYYKSSPFAVPQKIIQEDSYSIITIQNKKITQLKICYSVLARKKTSSFLN